MGKEGEKEAEFQEWELTYLSIRDVDQLISEDGETYQSILPQPSVWQFGFIKGPG